MIKNRKQKVILFSLLFVVSLIAASPTMNTMIQSSNDSNNQAQLSQPSASAIFDNNITYNSPVVRVLGTMNVQVDLTSYNLNENNVNLTIFLNNGTSLVYSMTHPYPTSHIWSKGYTPSPTAPLGEQNFTINVNSSTGPIISNNQTFTIKDSLPQINIQLSNSVIYRNNSISFNVTPSDAENNLAQLTWSSQIVNVSNNNAILATFPKPYAYNMTYPFSIYSQLGTYEVIANVTDLDGNTTTNHAYFTVANNPPTIIGHTLSISANETGGVSTNPDLNQILRVSGRMDVAVNVTDVEFNNDNSQLAVMLTATDERNDTLDLSSFGTTPIKESNYKTFSFDNIKIPSSAPAGNWSLNITAYKIDEPTCNSSFVYSFIVINNIPNASLIQYSINNNTAQSQSLSFQEFQNLVFDINVTGVDPEGVQFVKLDIVGQDNQWYNFTFSNSNNDLVNFTLNAGVLAPGQYYVYVYVVDGDGVQVGTANVMSFVILPDTFSSFLPWLMLIFGIIAGAGVMLVILGSRYRSLRKDYVDLVSGADYKEILERREKSGQKGAQEISNKEEIEKKEPKSNKNKKKKRKMIRKLD